jgi:hypothetical protein
LFRPPSYLIGLSVCETELMIVMRRPLFTPRKALSIWFLSALMASAIVRGTLEILPESSGYMVPAVIIVYYAGHLVTAVALTKGRLAIEFPIDRSWIDAIVVVGAPWVGAIAWYREWKKQARAAERREKI